MIDRATFFASVRTAPFGGSMSRPQVDGCSAILSEWERRKLTDLRWLAYMLATAFWETARTMQPINEYGGAAYFRRMYDPEGSRPELARKNGNVNPGDGVRYHGRGYVQLTWRDNYSRMGELLKIPLEDEPDLALDPKHAAAIMFEGMIRGMFTGKALALYFNDHGGDWINARRIINGTDKSAEIAAIAKQFHAALVAAEDGKPVQPKPAAPKSDLPKPSEYQPVIKPGLVATIVAAILSLFRKA
jgi:hypothetical protein